MFIKILSAVINHLREQRSFVADFIYIIDIRREFFKVSHRNGRKNFQFGGITYVQNCKQRGFGQAPARCRSLGKSLKNSSYNVTSGTVLLCFGQWQIRALNSWHSSKA